MCSFSIFSDRSLKFSFFPTQEPARIQGNLLPLAMEVQPIMIWFLVAVLVSLTLGPLAGPFAALALLGAGLVITAWRGPLSNPDLWSGLLGLFAGQATYQVLNLALATGAAPLSPWIKHGVGLGLAAAFVFAQAARRFETAINRWRGGRG